MLINQMLVLIEHLGFKEQNDISFLKIGGGTDE